jgi:putative membrane protein
MSSEQRLHPVSIFFRLAGQLREFIVPAIVLLFVARRRSGYDQILIAGAVLVITSITAVTHYFSFRYRYGPAELMLRWGFVFRKQRHIPYDRIQNIDAKQNLLQRWWGVVSVSLQTGSGSEPEATFNVLPVAALEEMRARVFEGRGASTPTADAETASPGTTQPADRVLLRLSWTNLALAGLIENRGITLILGALGVLSQVEISREWVGGALYLWIPEVVKQGGGWQPSIAKAVLATGAGILAVLLFVRLMSAVWALVRLHDLTLTRRGEDLRTEYGFFTRVTATIPLQRIQTITVHETLLHRRLKRAAVRVTTAGGGSGQSGAVEREWIAPIIPTESLAGLLSELHPNLTLENLNWSPPHPRTFGRLLRRSLAVAAVTASVSALILGGWAVAAFAALAIWGMVSASLRVRNLRWAMAADGLVFRSGFWRRATTTARFARVQAVELAESPFDRRTGMASVRVDTAGTGGAETAMPYLAREDAIKLRDLTAARAADTAFTW